MDRFLYKFIAGACAFVLFAIFALVLGAVCFGTEKILAIFGNPQRIAKFILILALGAAAVVIIWLFASGAMFAF